MAELTTEQKAILLAEAQRQGASCESFRVEDYILVVISGWDREVGTLRIDGNEADEFGKAVQRLGVSVASWPEGSP